MIQLVKALLYLIVAHIFYNSGFNTEEKLLDFITLMSCLLLMDICSYFLAKFALLMELEDDEDEDL